jgi:hypothetical protein
VPDVTVSTNRTRARPRTGGTGPKQRRSRDGSSHNGRWGDKLAYKTNKTSRYSFVNINGLPSMAHHEKHDQIVINTIQKHKIDVLGLAELNINLLRLGPTNQWKAKFKTITDQLALRYKQTHNINRKKSVRRNSLHCLRVGKSHS